MVTEMKLVMRKKKKELVMRNPADGEWRSLYNNGNVVYVPEL